MKAQFKTNQEALNFFLQQAQDLEKKHNRSFEDLFLEVEHSISWTTEQEEIFHLQQKIKTCKYLTLKERYG